MTAPAPSPPKVVIVGAGWAGLACAVRLASRGIPAVVLESARQLGGRARRIRLGELRVDNGQHLLLGAYRATLSILGEAGIPPRRALRRMPLDLRMLEPAAPGMRLKVAALPAPLHLLTGLLRAHGLGWRDRRGALALGLWLRRAPAGPAPDVSVRNWLDELGQTPRACRLLWEPLCLAALNTPPERASARIFARVLRDALLDRRSSSDLLLPRLDLGEVFPEPAAQTVERAGGKVELGRRVTALCLGADGIDGVRAGAELLAAGHVVVATSSTVAARLLGAHPGLDALGARIARLRHQPITTVYLQYPAGTSTGHPLIGLSGTATQWVVDRAVCGQPGLMAAVISAEGPHMRLGTRELAARTAAELARVFPRWPAPVQLEVVREKRATFSCDAGVDALRPAARTPVPGLWLAGDYTATPYPGTLEGAVRSGIECAEEIAREAAQGRPPSRGAQ